MRRATPLALALLCACPSPYRKPCSVMVKVTLDESQNIDKTCRSRGARRWDNGLLIRDSETIGGCAPTDGKRDEIVVPEDQAIVLHELRHVWDRRCSRAVGSPLPVK